MKTKKYYHIYKIINLINHKIYIGRHYGKIEDKYSGSGLLLNKAYKKYGKNNFKKELIEINNNLLENKNREKFWIKELNSFQPNGYNINEGGDGGDNITNNPNYDKICKNISESVKRRNSDPEYRKKQSIKMIGENNPMYGKNFQSWGLKKKSQENKGKKLEQIYGEEKANIIKQKLSKAHKGRIFNEDTLLKMSKANKGKNNPMYKPLSQDIIDKVLKEYQNTDIVNLISLSTNISLYDIKKVLKEYNLPFVSKKGIKMKGKNNPRYIDGRCINQITKDNEQEFLKLYNNRIALHKICKQLNIGWSIIQKYIKEHNLSRKRPPTGRAANKIVGAE